MKEVNRGTSLRTHTIALNGGRNMSVSPAHTRIWSAEFAGSEIIFQMHAVKKQTHGRENVSHKKEAHQTSEEEKQPEAEDSYTTFNITSRSQKEN